MASVKHAMQAKSDQLNYVDIGTAEMLITITNVVVKEGDQPVSIFYENSGNRPYKPSKGMVRLIVEGWGDESDNWIGKSIMLYGDKDVKWAGEAIGGIRIKAMSNVNKSGFSAYVALSRGKRRKVKVDNLTVQASETEQSWVDAINNGSEKLESITDLAFKKKIENLISQ